jgi:hypothetical protein
MSKKIEAFWVDATADDVARVMNGEKVEARFRDDGLPLWSYQTLSGWQTTGVRPLWHSSDGFVWARCQVYREPSWWTDKPDPGPGFRLLEKLPDEEPQLGDSVFCPGSEIWLDLEAPFEPGQRNALWYRRRIEAVEPAESKPLLIRRWTVDPGDEIKLPNGRMLVISHDGFEVAQ